MIAHVLTFLVLVSARAADDGDRDLAELLASITDITKDRWHLAFDANTNTIDLTARQRIAATMRPVYSGPGGEEMYLIRYRFRVVPPVDENGLARLRGQLLRELADVRAAARSVPQQEIKGYVDYYPRTAVEWEAVLRVKRAETRFKQVPQYVFKGNYLLSDSGADCFQPRAGDPLGEAMAHDIKAVFSRLRPLQTAPEVPATYPPDPPRR
jgi:hypothetical protein